MPIDTRLALMTKQPDTASPLADLATFNRQQSQDAAAAQQQAFQNDIATQQQARAD